MTRSIKKGVPSSLSIDPPFLIKESEPFMLWWNVRGKMYKGLHIISSTRRLVVRLCQKQTSKTTYLNVSQCTSEHTQIGGFLLIYVGDVLLQRLKTLLQVCSSNRHKTQQRGDFRLQKWQSHTLLYFKLHGHFLKNSWKIRRDISLF